MKAAQLQPQVVPAAPAVRLGGLTPEVMLFAVLLVLPALWHSIVEGDLPLTVVLERYIFIAVGCAIVATLVQGYSESARAVSDRVGRLESAPAPAPTRSEPVAVVAEPIDVGVPTAVPDLGADPLPDLGSLDDLDSLDLLSDESAEEMPKSFSLFDE